MLTQKKKKVIEIIHLLIESDNYLSKREALKVQ